MIPEFQIRGSLGVVHQMTRKWESGSKIRKLHPCISHDSTVSHGRTIRGNDSLCGDRNSGDFFRRILIFFDKMKYLAGKCVVLFRRVFVGKWNRLHRDGLTVQIHRNEMKHAL